MDTRDIFTVLLTTFAGMAVLYAPQPLFPALAERFAVSETAVASLITWSLVPMAVSPLFVGLLMQTVAPRYVLAASASLLGVTELLFAFTDLFFGVIAIRFLQGALVSTMLASTMTYVSLKAARVSRVMALYVASSILGGLLGRLAVGYGAAWLGVPAVFVGVGAVTIGGAGLAWALSPEPETPDRKIELGRLTTVLRSSPLVLLYGVVFSAFFVFTALLNFVPFRVSDLGVDGSGTAGLAYIGFILGLVAALTANRVVDKLGGQLRAVGVGSLLLASALGFALVENYLAVVGSVVVASVGFFLVHTVLSGYVNQHAGEKASSVNGLYVSIYYAGGAIGSYVPGLIYETVGWTAFLGILSVISVFGMVLFIQAIRTAPPRLSTVPRG
jgi:YNFM family putative membrane transporter